MQAVKIAIEEQLLEEYRASQLAFNVTYAVTTVYTLFMFLWLFANCKKELLVAARHNREILFMVPLTIIAKARPLT